MRYLLLVVFSFTALLFIPVRAEALSPGPDVYECWEEERSGSLTDSCAVTLCEFNNIERNWPENTGYYEDCSKYENQEIRYLVAGILGILGVSVGILLIIMLAKKQKIDSDK